MQTTRPSQATPNSIVYHSMHTCSCSACALGKISTHRGASSCHLGSLLLCLKSPSPKAAAGSLLRSSGGLWKDKRVMEAVEEGLGREGVCGWGGGSTGKGLGRGRGSGGGGQGRRVGEARGGAGNGRRLARGASLHTCPQAHPLQHLSATPHTMGAALEPPHPIYPHS